MVLSETCWKGVFFIKGRISGAVMSIPRGILYGLLAVIIIAALISAFPMLAAVGIIIQFAVILAAPLLAAIVLIVPRFRKALFKAAESPAPAMPEAPRELSPSLLSVIAGKEPRRSIVNGLEIAAVIIVAVVAFPLLATLGLAFQFLAIILLFIVLLSPFLVRAFRTPKSSR